MDFLNSQTSITILIACASALFIGAYYYMASVVGEKREEETN